MIVCAAQVSIRLAGMSSLKDKRRVIRSLLASIRNMGLSAAEVDDHDLWGNATLGFAVAHSSTVDAQNSIDKAIELIESCPEVVQCDAFQSSLFM